MKSLVNLVHIFFLTTLSLLFVSCNAEPIAVLKSGAKAGNENSGAAARIWRSDCYLEYGQPYRTYLQFDGDKITSLTVIYRDSMAANDLTNCQNLTDPEYSDSYFTRLQGQVVFGAWTGISYYDVAKGNAISQIYQVEGDKMYVLKNDDLSLISTDEDLINLQINDLVDPYFYQAVDEFPNYSYEPPR